MGLNERNDLIRPVRIRRAQELGEQLEDLDVAQPPSPIDDRKATPDEVLVSGELDDMSADDSALEDLELDDSPVEFDDPNEETEPQSLDDLPEEVDDPSPPEPDDDPLAGFGEFDPESLARPPYRPVRLRERAPAGPVEALPFYRTWDTPRQDRHHIQIDSPKSVPAGPSHPHRTSNLADAASNRNRVRRAEQFRAPFWWVHRGQVARRYRAIGVPWERHVQAAANRIGDAIGATGAACEVRVQYEIDGTGRLGCVVLTPPGPDGDELAQRAISTANEQVRELFGPGFALERFSLTGSREDYKMAVPDPGLLHPRSEPRPYEGPVASLPLEGPYSVPPTPVSKESIERIRRRTQSWLSGNWTEEFPDRIGPSVWDLNSLGGLSSNQREFEERFRGAMAMRITDWVEEPTMARWRDFLMELFLVSTFPTEVFEREGIAFRGEWSATCAPYDEALDIHENSKVVAVEQWEGSPETRGFTGDVARVSRGELARRVQEGHLAAENKVLRGELGIEHLHQTGCRRCKALAHAAGFELLGREEAKIQRALHLDEELARAPSIDQGDLLGLGIG